MAKQKNFVISKEVVASLLPQRSLLNQKADELLNQTFILNSVVESEDFDEDNDRLTGPVRLRFMNKKNGTLMVFPIRGLLFSDSTTVKDAAKYDHKTSEKVVLHTRLLEAAANDDDVKIPEEFTVMNVETRKNINDETVYPSYAYKAFQERVEALKEDEDISSIYQDFNFMTGLSGGELATRFKDIEPVKNVVISL